MPRIGDQVRVIDGPFEDFVGEVTLVDAVRRKVTIVVNMYGRQTPCSVGLRSGGCNVAGCRGMVCARSGHGGPRLL